MAPEILEEQPYDRAVDWWAYGVLMYEMLLGRAPFSGEEEDDIYDSILEDEPLYPPGFGRHEQALLQSVCLCSFLVSGLVTPWRIANIVMIFCAEASSQGAKSASGSGSNGCGRNQGARLLQGCQL